MATDTETERRNRSCEDRIGEEAENRLADIRRFNHKYTMAGAVGKYDAGDRLLVRQQESILDVEKKTFYRVLLSCGGPQDWFDVYVDDRQIQYIEYHFSDWFDHADRNLTGAEFDDVEKWLHSVVYMEEVL